MTATTDIDCQYSSFGTRFFNRKRSFKVTIERNFHHENAPLHLWRVATRLVMVALIICFCRSSFSQDATHADSVSESKQVARRVDEQRDQPTREKFDVVKTGAVIYRNEDDFQLKCDLYVPQERVAQSHESSRNFPAIVAIHGGAWRSGSKITMLRHAYLFARSGYVVMAINYRHAPEHRFPAQIHDCKFAVRWLKANATRWQVDPDRIGAFGYSAGGHLASLLGTTNADDQLEGNFPEPLDKLDSKIVCVAAGGAPCEFSWIGEDSAVLKPWIGSTRADAPKRYEKASPLVYADAADVPHYFFHGQYDLIVPIDSSLKLHHALKTAGVSSKHEVALLTGHVATFSNMLWAEKSLRFFNRHLTKVRLSAKTKE